MGAALRKRASGYARIISPPSRDIRPDGRLVGDLASVRSTWCAQLIMRRPMRLSENRHGRKRPPCPVVCSRHWHLRSPLHARLLTGTQKPVQCLIMPTSGIRPQRRTVLYVYTGVEQEPKLSQCQKAPCFACHISLRHTYRTQSLGRSKRHIRPYRVSMGLHQRSGGPGGRRCCPPCVQIR